MLTTIQKWGNSQGLRLNKTLLAEAGLEIGHEVDVVVQDGALMITPARRVRGGHNLRSLVRQIPKDQPPPEWHWGPPAGREVW